MVDRIKLYAGEAGDFLFFCGEGGGADTEERIEQVGMVAFAVDFDALFCKGDREGGRVWPLAFAGLDCIVGDKPGVSAAPEVLPAGVAPACDV